jgi:hypothetical protein
MRARQRLPLGLAVLGTKSFADASLIVKEGQQQLTRTTDN